MHFINNSDLMGPDWRFVEPLCRDPDITWSFHSGVPRNLPERLVRRPKLARYRAAWQAVQEARRGTAEHPVLVSHLPRITAATNILRRTRCPDVPMIGFSFNFTDLPQGRSLGYFRRALGGITEIVVYSTMERALYSRLFDIAPDRVHVLPWAMDPPKAGAETPVPGLGPYLCAVGGEARDYALLARVMAGLPALRMVVVARPYSIRGIDFPENVTVFTNLPAPQTWRLVRDSLGMVIPLRSDTTACGHITLVGTQLSGVPLAITRSEGVADYIDDETAILFEAGDAAGLEAAITRLTEDRETATARAEAAAAVAAERSNPARWAAYFEDLKGRLS